MRQKEVERWGEAEQSYLSRKVCSWYFGFVFVKVN